MKGKVGQIKGTKYNKLPIDWDEVATYLKSQATGYAIAEILGITANTLYIRCKEELGMTFGQYKAMHRGAGKQRLREKLFEEAMKGNPTLLIWLSKNWMPEEYQDKKEVNVSVKEWSVGFANELTDGNDDEGDDEDHYELEEYLGEARDGYDPYSL